MYEYYIDDSDSIRDSIFRYIIHHHKKLGLSDKDPYKYIWDGHGEFINYQLMCEMANEIRNEIDNEILRKLRSLGKNDEDTISDTDD